MKGKFHYKEREPDHAKFDFDLGLLKRAKALIEEAAFIGIIRAECKGHYINIGRSGTSTFNNLRDILSIEKAELVKQYDRLLAHNKLADLNPTEYEKLYRAKWLVPSKRKPI